MVRTSTLALALVASVAAVFTPLASARLMSPAIITSDHPFLPTTEQVGTENVCWRNLYLRGVGKIERECADGEEPSMGLCYTPCKGTFVGVGPVCYAGCPAGDSIGIGPICCAAFQDCSSRVIELAIKLPIDIIKAYNDREDPARIIQDLKKAFEDALGFKMPTCDVTDVLNIEN